MTAVMNIHMRIRGEGAKVFLNKMGYRDEAPENLGYVEIHIPNTFDTESEATFYDEAGAVIHSFDGENFFWDKLDDMQSVDWFNDQVYDYIECHKELFENPEDVEEGTVYVKNCMIQTGVCNVEVYNTSIWWEMD